MIKIRNFQIEDLEKICKFKRESVKVSFPGSKVNINLFKKKLLKQIKVKPDSIKVLEKDNILIGYIWLRIIKTSISKYGKIHHIFVDKNYRNLGLGKKLIWQAEKYFKSNNVNKIRLTVTKSNRVAINFYKKLGFEEKRIVMEKEL